MAASLTFTLDGGLAMEEALSQAAARGRDLRPALRSIGQAGVAQTRKRFVASRGPDGAPWKKGAKRAGQTLIEKGLLLRSISARPPEANAVEWGSNRVYAAIHQFGFDGIVKVPAHTRRFTQVFGRALSGTAEVKAHDRHMKMPARPYLGVNDQDMNEFASILVRHVAEPLGGAA